MKKTGRQVSAFYLACAFCTGAVYESESFCCSKDNDREENDSKNNPKRKNGLYKEGNGKFCYYQNNKRIKNTWKTIKGGKYYFDKNGYALITLQSWQNIVSV